MGNQSWDTWKELIKAQFGTRLWRTNMCNAFEKDFFDPLKHKPNKWCLSKKKRMDCIYSTYTLQEMNDRLLNQCKGNLEHAMRCRIQNTSIDLSEFIGIMEEVIEMTGMNKTIQEF